MLTNLFQFYSPFVFSLIWISNIGLPHHCSCTRLPVIGNSIERLQIFQAIQFQSQRTNGRSFQFVFFFHFFPSIWILNSCTNCECIRECMAGGFTLIQQFQKYVKRFHLKCMQLLRLKLPIHSARWKYACRVCEKCSSFIAAFGS